jgi:DNA-binding CsgD family transcriptional regulator
VGEQAAGWCSVCSRGPFTVLATGVVKTHGPRGARCEGSLEEPIAETDPAVRAGWCPVCRRGPFAIVLSGVLRTHGPVPNRCKGSLKESAGGPPRRRPRPLQVLAMAAQGLTDEQIAAQLFLTRNTVKTHLKRVYAQFGARDRAQAVHIACHRGLLPCRDEAVS